MRRKFVLTGWSFPMHILCVNDAEKLFDVALPESLKDFLPAGSDFKVDEAHVYYKGVCKACAMEA